MTAAAQWARTLQRVVLPAGDRGPDPDGADPDGPDVLPLYVERPGPAVRVVDRDTCVVGAGERVSFAAYFNAFPAAYWQRWTDVAEVVLVVHVSAAATVEVYRSDADGRAQCVAERAAAAVGGAVDVPVRLTGFDEGGWLWFEVRAHDTDVRVGGGRWTLPTGQPGAHATASLGITTYNRVPSCLGVLRGLGEDPALLEVVDRVYVVDQGDQRVSAAAGFADAAAGLGERLMLVEQENLGGSGGFARCQLETLRAGQSDHLVILDDDVVVETEAVRRAVVFAAHCPRPTLVGAHMFSLPEPTRLHAMAESVDLRRFRWGPTHEHRREHDLAAGGLRSTPWLHRREDVNYNGWWMCLIPRAVLERVGLSLPFFIRWDDAEYGLRAGAAGFPTVTLPGVAVWHMPWTQKTDALDWQAYFHQRNRVIAALLHSPHDHGGLLVPELLMHHVKHLAAMQYSTAELRLRALADVLAGPERLHDWLRTKVAQARETRAGFADADVRTGPDAFPPPRTAGGAGDAAARAARRTPPWAGAVAGVLRQMLPTSRSSRRTPQAHLAAGEAHWTRLVAYDSVVVSTADGSGAVWYRRDPQTFARMVWRGLAVHARLYRAWPRLAAEYRDALADTASPSAWERTLQLRRGG